MQINSTETTEIYKIPDSIKQQQIRQISQSKVNNMPSNVRNQNFIKYTQKCRQDAKNPIKSKYIKEYCYDMVCTGKNDINFDIEIEKKYSKTNIQKICKITNDKYFYDNIENIIVIGDIHGNINVLINILLKQFIIIEISDNISQNNGITINDKYYKIHPQIRYMNNLLIILIGDLLDNINIKNNADIDVFILVKFVYENVNVMFDQYNRNSRFIVLIGNHEINNLQKKFNKSFNINNNLCKNGLERLNLLKQHDFFDFMLCNILTMICVNKKIIVSHNQIINTKLLNDISFDKKNDKNIIIKYNNFIQNKIKTTDSNYILSDDDKKLMNNYNIFIVGHRSIKDGNRVRIINEGKDSLIESMIKLLNNTIYNNNDEIFLKLISSITNKSSILFNNTLFESLEPSTFLKKIFENKQNIDINHIKEYLKISFFNNTKNIYNYVNLNTEQKTVVFTDTELHNKHNSTLSYFLINIEDSDCFICESFI